MEPNREVEYRIVTSDLSESFGTAIRTKGCLLLFCLQGRAIVSANLERRVFRRGDIAVIFPDTLFVVHGTCCDFRVRTIEMSPELTDEVILPLSSVFFERIYDEPILPTTGEQRVLLETWNAHIDYYAQGSAAKSARMMMRNELQNLFLAMEVALVFDAPPEHVKSLSSSRRLFNSFCKLIAENCCSQHEVKFYADKLCITPYYLSKITARITEATPKQLIDWQIVMEIKHLLTTTDLTIKEIADRFRFDSTSYLGRYFRRYTGMTPSGFRQNNT